MPNSAHKTRRTLIRRERRTKSAARRIWRFEQLESRAMLSATMGPTFFGPVHGMDMHGYEQPQPPQAGMFAPDNFAMRISGPMGWDGPMGYPKSVGRYDESGWVPLHPNFGPPMGGYDSPAPQHSAYSSPIIQPTVTTVTTVTIVWIEPYVEPVTAPAKSAIKYEPITSLTPPASPPPQYGGTMHMDPPADMAQNPEPIVRNPFARDHDHDYDLNPKSFGGPNPLYYGSPVFTSVSALTSAATQSASHEVALPGLLSASALDAALQAYTSQLLLVTGGVNNLPVASSLNDKSISATDDTDGFVTLSDFQSARDIASDADALSRQQAAVEEVLRSLQGDDSLPADSTAVAEDHVGSLSDDQTAQAADFVFGTAYDVADVDGGMILLQTTGDANESPVNLARVAESHPDMFSPHVGVEASIGFYQAVDRGFDELSAVENAATPTSSATPASGKPDHRVSSNAGGSSRKTAGVLAATTLAGGLLWLAGRKQTDMQDEESSAKRSLVI